MNTLIDYIILSLLIFPNPMLPQNYFYSFENTYSGWDTVGIDLELGDTVIAWSIHPSNDLAIDSSFSMRYYLGNYNDQGKIWIQKPFTVEQSKDYLVTINYKFATRDFGLANLFTIISGVHLSPPTHANDLTYQGHTGNGFEFDTGFVWLDKSYEFNFSINTSSQLWVVIGIWGNWETPRIYYVDSLSIQIQEENPNKFIEDESLTNDFIVYQNYPNPFNPVTTIKYRITELSYVTINVYDVLGNEILQLINEEKSVGSYEVEFDATSLPSAMYFYRLQAVPVGRQKGNYIKIKKMVLLR